MTDMLTLYCDLLPGICPLSQSPSSTEVNYPLCTFAAVAVMAIVGATYLYVQRIVDDRNIPKPAIIMSVIASGAVAFALTYFFETTQAYDGADFWRSLSYFGIFIVAIITFVTTVWRGTIAQAQVKTAQNSLVATREQIAATERANMAQTIKEAVGLIKFHNPEDDGTQQVSSEVAENAAHSRAGLALLYSVGMNPKGEFAQQTIDIISEYLRNKRVNVGSLIPEADAIKYLVEIASNHKGIVILEETELTAPSRITKFKLSPNLSAKLYVDMTVDASLVSSLYLERFKDCTIFNGDFDHTNHAELDGAIEFKNCRIREMPIAPFDFDKPPTIHYERCTFIGTGIISLFDSTFSECTYDPQKPPHETVFNFVKESGGTLEPAS